MHALELRQLQSRADRREVDRLPAGHAARTTGVGKQSKLTARVTGAGLGDDFESEALQRVPGKQCDGLAESDMARRLAASEHVVVHARQVVVYERVSVDEFNRRRRRVDVRGVRVDSSPPA